MFPSILDRLLFHAAAEERLEVIALGLMLVVLPAAVLVAVVLTFGS